MADVAEELGVAERTVRHYIATGKLPAIRLNARTIRIDPAAVDKLIDKASA